MSKCLIIAGGPGVKKQLTDASKFKGIIFTVDTMLKKCVEAGVIPNYVMTVENISTFGYFFKDIPLKHAKKIIVVCSGRTHQNTRDVILSHGFKLIEFKWKFLQFTSNVGLMAFVYSWLKLGIYEIIIIGFDHCDYKRTGIPCFNSQSPQFALFYKQLINPHTKTVCYLDPIHQLWHEQFFDFLELHFYPHLKVYNCTEEGVIFGEKIIWSRLKEHL